MDSTETAVVAVLVVAVAGVFGYAYITGVGPLEENPTAGLEEPPETENTYDFGEVSETDGEAEEQGGSQDDAETEGGTEADGTDEGVETDGGVNAEVEPTEVSEDRIGDVEDENDGTDTGGGTGDDKGEEDTEGQTDDGAELTSDRYSEDDGGDTGDDGENSEKEEREKEERDGSDSDDDGDSGNEDDAGSRGAGVSTLEADQRTTGPPFVPELEEVERCGETCREVTVAMQNRMDVDAENIVVYVRLYAGDSTDPDAVVWGENRNLGTIGAGEVYRTTETVDLTPQQANKVREEDGLVTAKATIESQQATATFVERDNVK